MKISMTWSHCHIYANFHFFSLSLITGIPAMAAIAVRKKVISIGHFFPCFRFQSLQIFLFVRSNQEQLYVLNALKIRGK